MLWIRQEFIFHPHQTGATVVFGHTPMRAVMVDLPYKLGIDTGLVYGGKLTCLEFTEGVPTRSDAAAGRRKAQAIQLAMHRSRLFRLRERAQAILSVPAWRRSSVG